MLSLRFIADYFTKLGADKITVICRLQLVIGGAIFRISVGNPAMLEGCP